MNAALEMLQGSLAPTATYARRSWLWIPATGGTGDPYSDGRVGTLTIRLQRAERGNRRKPVAAESDDYGVQEETDPAHPHPPGVRAFLLLNDSDDEQPDVYRCVLGRFGATCTCKASACRLACKHSAAVAALIEAGGLDRE